MKPDLAYRLKHLTSSLQVYPDEWPEDSSLALNLAEQKGA